MSLPREILDQLLSGYMDDALSADERARVERLLETDPEVASELQQLRELGGSLRDVFGADSRVKLTGGFPDRVLDAAVACARREGLSEDHLLVRLTEQPSTKRQTPSSSLPWRSASVLVALAASVVFAVIALRPDGNPDLPGGLDVAMTDPTVADPNPNSVAKIDEDGLAVPDSNVPSPSVHSDSDIESIAGLPKAAGSSVAKSGVETQHPVIEHPSQPKNLGPPRAAIVSNDAEKSMPAERSTSVEPSTPAAARPKVAMIGGILLLDVRRTTIGVESKAVRAAMRSSSIGAASEKQISEKIVGLAKTAAGDADPEATVLYLQAPAKRLDQFILKLVADAEGIESVGFTLAEDAPILGMVQTLQSVDPATIRHAATWQLSSESRDWVGSLARDLGQRQYATIDRGTAEVGAASAMAGGSPDSGPDVLTQVLVLIR